jgi:nucleoid-associated protein EbfC
MFGDLMSKMNEARIQMDAAKKKLDSITVEGYSNNKKVIVTSTGNKKIIDISIAQELLNDKEELEDSLLIAFNKALEAAEAISEKEMKNVASGMMPGLF